MQWPGAGPSPRIIQALGLARTPDIAAARAVVIGDAPNLSELDAELDAVRQALQTRGWQLGDHWSPDDLEQPRLLHLAGHASWAGDAGWDSGLELPDQRRLTVTDLLLERRAPALVVLGACEAGTTDPSMLDGGMNLAVAFLLAGAELVIAADRRLADADARAMATALYARLPPADQLDAHALIDALGQLQREDPRALAWRAWVR